MHVEDTTSSESLLKSLTLNLKLYSIKKHPKIFIINILLLTDLDWAKKRYRNQKCYIIISIGL